MCLAMKPIASGTLGRVEVSKLHVDVDANETDRMFPLLENHAEWRREHSRCFDCSCMRRHVRWERVWVVLRSGVVQGWVFMFQVLKSGIEL